MWSVIVFSLSLYFMKREDTRVLRSAEERYFRFSFGNENLVYSTKFSIYSLTLIFCSHFGITVIYAQLVESLGYDFTVICLVVI